MDLHSVEHTPRDGDLVKNAADLEREVANCGYVHTSAHTSLDAALVSDAVRQGCPHFSGSQATFQQVMAIHPLTSEHRPAVVWGGGGLLAVHSWSLPFWRQPGLLWNKIKCVC